MLPILLALFVVVPIVEIVAIVLVANLIGNSATVLLLVALGALGAWYAKREGVAALRVTRDGLAAGRLPSRHLADGVVALVAGVLLVVPGFLTAIVGLVLLTGPGRDAASRALLARARLRVDGLSTSRGAQPRPTGPAASGSGSGWHGFRPDEAAGTPRSGAGADGARFGGPPGPDVDSDVIDVEWAEETVYDDVASPLRGELRPASDDPHAF